MNFHIVESVHIIFTGQYYMSNNYVYYTHSVNIVLFNNFQAQQLVVVEKINNLLCLTCVIKLEIENHII